MIAVAVEPKTKADQEKMGIALQKVAAEDPSFPCLKLTKSQVKQSFKAWVSCILEIIVDRMKREFKVDAAVGKPKLHTVRRLLSLEAETKYVRQTGGRGQYGHVWLKIEPQEFAGYQFINNIVGGVIPKEYIPAIDKGIQEQMKNGINAGFEVVDVKVTLFDGSFHDVDSSEMAFKIAGSMAFKKWS